MNNDTRAIARVLVNREVEATDTVARPIPMRLRPTAASLGELFALATELEAIAMQTGSRHVWEAVRATERLIVPVRERFWGVAPNSQEAR